MSPTPKGPRPRVGWRSTKLHLALITMALVTVVYGLIGFPPDQFPTYVTGLGAAAAIYSGAAAAEKFSRGGEA